MFTDADFDMRDFAEMAQNAANGVCSICEEALNPFDPSWANEITPDQARSIAECYGPVADGLPYHQSCLDEPGW